MPAVYPTSFLLLTGLSILFSFCNACLSAFNFSDFMMFINAPIAGLTFVYHITLLTIAYRHSVRSYVTPGLFVASQWSNIVIVALLLALWTVSLGLAVEVVASNRRSSSRGRAAWDMGLQVTLITFAGLQIITLALTIWAGVYGRMKFKLDAEMRVQQKLRAYVEPKISRWRRDLVFSEPEGSPSTTPSTQEKDRLASLPRLVIPSPIHPVPSVNPVHAAAPRAKIKHSALPGWHFLTPEIRPSPVTATTARTSQLWH